MIFDINGAKVEFNEKKHNYNLIRREFKFFANNSKNDFNENMINTTINLNELLEKSLKLYNEYLELGLRKSIESIIEYKLITIDKNTFKNEYCTKYLTFERILNNKIKNLNQKGKKHNFLTYDSINKLIFEISELLYNDCFKIHCAVVDALLENNIDKISRPITDDDIKISNSLFNNYKDGFIHKIDEHEVVSKMIYKNPYNLEMYEYLVKEDGDFNREIERLVNYLGYEIKDYKELLIDNYIENIINEENFDKEIDKEKVSKYAKYIGCENSEIYVTRIDAIYTFQDA